MPIEPTLQPSIWPVMRELDRRLAILERRRVVRGGTGRAENASNVTLSTTAGTYTEVVTANNVPVVFGRIYLVTFYGGDNLLSGGSGFATSDTWKMKLEVDTGIGFVDISGPWTMARAYVASGHRYHIPVGMARWVADVTGASDFQASATKASGASTVTSTLETGSGATPFALLIEEIGV